MSNVCMLVLSMKVRKVREDMEMGPMPRCRKCCSVIETSLAVGNSLIDRKKQVPTNDNNNGLLCHAISPRST